MLGEGEGGWNGMGLFWGEEGRGKRGNYYAFGGKARWYVREREKNDNLADEGVVCTLYNHHKSK